ncbi:hypothetical protein GUJ93_ZPchr0109g40569 [Zizania palustris]|uniref:Uncharacterized protein n=1 Tax=Zizania palustris TaxID=103762 RepID=A0A8J5R7U9_ZIZPA|nr:hypothetical protein GUJ93_ZPchr0109g40569 [Zizania palustris]
MPPPGRLSLAPPARRALTRAIGLEGSRPRHRLEGSLPRRQPRRNNACILIVVLLRSPHPVAASGRRIQSPPPVAALGRRLRSPPDLLRHWVQQEQIESRIKQPGSVHSVMFNYNCLN